MSIITEALKKAQKDSGRTDIAPPAERESFLTLQRRPSVKLMSSQKRERPEPGKNIVRTAFLVIFMTCILSVSVYMVYLWFGRLSGNTIVDDLNPTEPNAHASAPPEGNISPDKFPTHDTTGEVIPAVIPEGDRSKDPEEANPLVLLETDSSNATSLPELTGIMYAPSKPLVILDDSMVSEGDTVRGFTVTEILPDRIIGDFGGNLTEIRLK